MSEMTVRSSTRGLPGLPRGRCGLSASQASSDNQNKLFAMTIAPSDSNQAQIYNQNPTNCMGSQPSQIVLLRAARTETSHSGLSESGPASGRGGAFGECGH